MLCLLLFPLSVPVISVDVVDFSVAYVDGGLDVVITHYLSPVVRVATASLLHMVLNIFGLFTEGCSVSRKCDMTSGLYTHWQFRPFQFHNLYRILGIRSKGKLTPQ